MNRFAVGKITGCFGIRGEVKIHPTTHDVERLSLLEKVSIGTSELETREYVVEQVVLRDGIALMRFRDIGDRNAAGDLVGKFVFVEEADVDRPAKGAYFIHDIIGCEVYSTDGNRIGTVEEVQKFPAQDVWAVRNGTKLHLIPAVKEFIQEVNLESHRIIIKVIEGLIEGV